MFQLSIGDWKWDPASPPQAATSSIDLAHGCHPSAPSHRILIVLINSTSTKGLSAMIIDFYRVHGQDPSTRHHVIVLVPPRSS